MEATAGRRSVAKTTENENVDGETLRNEDRSETSFSVPSVSSSSSREVDDWTTVEAETDARVCFVPLCGSGFTIMCFFGLLCSYALRVNLGAVAVVNHTALTDDVEMMNSTNTCGKDQCPRDPGLQHADGQFTWDRHQQAAALTTFYYGYVIIQITGGWLADRFGGKWPFGVSVLVQSVISLLSPAAVRLHLGVFLLLRVLAGLSSGLQFPAMHALIARWSAPSNRSLVVTRIVVGTNTGVVVGMVLSGVQCDLGFAGGWPSVFYVLGLVGCLWSGAWFLLVYDPPATHPRMSAAELEYWEEEIGTAEMITGPPTPWRKILTSVPVWALGIALCAVLWVYLTAATCIPLFVTHDVLGLDTTKNGIVSAVPFAALILMIPVGGLDDWLRSPGRLSTDVVRKVFYASGFFPAACVIIFTGYVGCVRVLAVVFMFLSIAFLSISRSVADTNHKLDLGDAGWIMGLTNFVGSLSAIAAPHVVGSLTYHKSTHSEWQSVFLLTAAIYAVGAVVFVVFGSDNRQR